MRGTVIIKRWLAIFGLSTVFLWILLSVTPAKAWLTHPLPTSVSIIPYRIIPVDIDGDGRLECLVGFDSGLGPPKLASMLRVVDFSVSPPVVQEPAIPFGGERAHLLTFAANDVNHDGFPDLAVSTHRPYVSVILNAHGQGFGSYQRYPTHDVTKGVRLADVNGDRLPDLVYTTENDPSWVDRLVYRLARLVLRRRAERMPFRFLQPPGALKIRLGRGDGTFGQEIVYDASPKAYSVELGDLDLDGDFDFVVTHESTNRISIFYNAGDGTAGGRTQLVTTGDRANHIAIADLDADGDPDLIVANWGWYDDSGRSSITLFFNNGHGRFGEGQDIPTSRGSCWIKTADLDRDGDIDFVVTSWLSAYTTVFLNNGRGAFQTHSIQTGDGNYGQAVVDLNGDRIPDLLTANWREESISRLIGRGDGSFAAAQKYRFVLTNPHGVQLVEIE